MWKVVGALLAVVVLSGGCTGSNDDEAAVPSTNGSVAGETDDPTTTASSTTESSTTESSTTSTTSTTAVSTETSLLTSTTSSTTTTPAPRIANDAESNLRFDVGSIEGTVELDGVHWISFDRFQDLEGRNGTDWNTEPLYAAATDANFINQNPRLRNFPLSPSVDVLLMANLDAVCLWWFDPDAGEREIRWESVGVAGVGNMVDQYFVSLTFDGAGNVIRIRDQRGC